VNEAKAEAKEDPATSKIVASGRARLLPI